MTLNKVGTREMYNGNFRTHRSYRDDGLSGFRSLEDNSFPDFSEFDSESVVLEYVKERLSEPPLQKTAPTTQIETITISRPLKIIAFVCGIIAVILLVIALASTDWLISPGWRQGLFMHCIENNVLPPLPFNLHDAPGCYTGRDILYIKIASCLCIASLITDIAATAVTGLGLKTQNTRKKYRCYRWAVIIMFVSLVSLLTALVLYPICFAAEVNRGNSPVWEFGWAYGVGWGTAFFLLGALALLLCDKESEEIYYKERRIVHECDIHT